MTRKAILIAGGNDPHIGAEQDVYRFRHFLRSKIGGAWNDDGVEIEWFINPVSQDLVAPFIDAAEADYAFILFSGHGTHPAYSLNPYLTRLALADSDMRASDLNPRNGKSLIIVDACRAFARMPSTILEFYTEHRRIAGRDASREAYRGMFDDAIASCSPQVTYLFSCSLDQYSYGNPTHGGLYSHTLISTAIDWEAAQNSPDTFLPIHNLHNWTRQRVRQTEKPTPQTPQIYRNIGTGRHLPFCLQM